jgi:hypothetical protein
MTWEPSMESTQVTGEAAKAFLMTCTIDWEVSPVRLVWLGICRFGLATPWHDRMTTRLASRTSLEL